MIRLTYVSTCAPDLSLSSVRSVLTRAKLENADAGVTGRLYWSREFFMQTLEGHRGAVTKCFIDLVNDPRHSNVELIHATVARTRWYSNWSVGFTQLLSSHRVRIAGLASNVLSFNPYLLEAHDLEETLALLARSVQLLVL
jgi:Sensors of blue-light using FAD